MPFVLALADGGPRLYYLIDEVSEDLEYFLETGKRPEKDRYTDKEYHVFPAEREQEMIARWTESGMTVTYHVQQIEIIHRITVRYMEVRNPLTGMAISLIPWFMVAGRPYPVSVYLYAIGHYRRSEKKSLEESAAAVRKLFGIGSFHKSTVSRSLKAMGKFIEDSKLDRPLATESLKDPACISGSPAETDRAGGDVAVRITEILEECPSVKALEKELGKKIRRLPTPAAGRTDRISRALGGIPDGQFEIITHGEPCGRRPGDGRNRPPRPREKKERCVQRPLNFVDNQRRVEKRKAFIGICRRVVLDAAATCHRFLI